MKRIQRINFIMIALILLAAAGCTKPGTGDPGQETTAAVTAPAVIPSETKVTKLPPEPDTLTEGSSSDSTDSSDQGTEASVTMRILPIYTMNAESLEPEAVTILVSQNQEITPEFIVASVSDTLEEQGYTIEVESVTTQDDAVVVSFYNDQPPVTFGSSAESSILDVYAQSLVDNLPDYNKVIYRLEGKAYVSGHFEFGVNQVYLERTAMK